MNPNIQKRKRIYRCVLLCLLLIVFGAISCRYYTAAAKKIPTKLILYKNRTESFNLGFPFYAKLSSDDAKAVSFQNDVKSTNHARSGRKIQAVGNHIGSYKAGLSLDKRGTAFGHQLNDLLIGQYLATPCCETG